MLPSSWEYENPEQQRSSSAQGRWCAQERKGTNVCGLTVIFFLSHKLVEQTAVCVSLPFCVHSLLQWGTVPIGSQKICQSGGRSWVFLPNSLDFKIQNMVGSCDVKFPIRLEAWCLHTSSLRQVCRVLFIINIVYIAHPKLNWVLFCALFVLKTFTFSALLLFLPLMLIDWRCILLFAIPWSIYYSRDGKTTTLISCWCFFPSYEPELFPGLIYRMIKPRIVLLIFVSGKGCTYRWDCCSF